MTMGDGDAGGRLFPEDMNAVDPVAAVMLADACRSITGYPELIVAGALFTGAEQLGGGWQVVCPCDPLPQGARELLAAHLHNRAALAGEATREFHAAARELERRPRDELPVAGRRFRIVRIEQLVRTGPEGPEPPRPTDHDPRKVEPGRAVPPRPYDFIGDGRDTPDIITAELLCQYLDAAARAGSEPSDPFLTPVLLSPAFTVAERGGEQWEPAGRLHNTPQQARDALATYFRHVVPAVEHPAAADLLEYAEAAEMMEDQHRRNGIDVVGRRFRVVRIERIVLVGPEGPETPRSADFDAE